MFPFPLQPRVEERGLLYLGSRGTRSDPGSGSLDMGHCDLGPAVLLTGSVCLRQWSAVGLCVSGLVKQTFGDEDN